MEKGEKNYESMLEMIFSNRLNELVQTTGEDMEELKKGIEFINEDELIGGLLKDVPQRDKILSVLEKVDENNDYQMGYYCSKYYKNGFKDGVKLMVECLKK